MNKLAKKNQNEQARKYILANPDCTYEDLVKSLNYPELSKPYFYNMRGNLRKAGLAEKPVAAGRGHRENGASGYNGLPPLHGNRMEILESIDVSGLADEVRTHYKTHTLPLLRKLLPGGKDIQVVFLENPSTMEIRRPLS